MLHPISEPLSELRGYAKHHRALSQRLCAAVEFSNFEAARKAYGAWKAEEETSNDEGSCRARLIFHPMLRITEDEPEKSQEICW